MVFRLIVALATMAVSFAITLSIIDRGVAATAREIVRLVDP
jgi:hypothetical protein